MIRIFKVFYIAVSFILLTNIAFADEVYLPTHYAIQGQYVNASGQKLWAEKYGAGQPVIILFNGAGDIVREWNSIIPVLAKTSTVVGFDYPGLGQSLPLVGLSQTYTAAKAASNLQELLKALNLPPPYILVGHSIGRLYAAYFARRYPDEVAGIVTIDGNTVENVFWNQLNITDTPKNSNEKVELFTKEEKARTVKLEAQDQSLQQQKSLSSVEMQELANNLEVLGKPRSAREIEGLGHLPNVPLIALSAGTDPTYDLWHKSIKQFADQVPCSIFQVVPNSGHYIQIDQPEVVITAIQKVILTVQNNRSLCK